MTKNKMHNRNAVDVRHAAVCRLVVCQHKRAHRPVKQAPRGLPSELSLATNLKLWLAVAESSRIRSVLAALSTRDELYLVHRIFRRSSSWFANNRIVFVIARAQPPSFNALTIKSSAGSPDSALGNVSIVVC